MGNFSKITTKGFYGIRVTMPFVSVSYIKCLLQSEVFFSELDMGHKILSLNKLKNFEIPMPSIRQQRIFEKLCVYIDSDNFEYGNFFLRVSDRLVEELFFENQFLSQKISLFDSLDKLPYINETDLQKNDKIKAVYEEVSKGGSEIMSKMAVASGISYSYYYYNEKDK